MSFIRSDLFFMRCSSTVRPQVRCDIAGILIVRGCLVMKFKYSLIFGLFVRPRICATVDIDITLEGTRGGRGDSNTCKRSEDSDKRDR